MPRGKNKNIPTTITVDQPPSDDLPVVPVEAERIKIRIVCNHRNMHYTAGELTCILEPGHKEDHFGYINGKPTAWSDAAGTPVKRSR